MAQSAHVTAFTDAMIKAASVMSVATGKFSTSAIPNAAKMKYRPLRPTTTPRNASGNAKGLLFNGTPKAATPKPGAAAGGGSKFLRSADRFGARVANTGSRAVNWIGRHPKTSLALGAGALGTYAAYRGTRGVIDSVRGNKDD